MCRYGRLHPLTLSSHKYTFSSGRVRQAKGMMMRWLRRVVTLAATTTLVMGLAAPAFAAPPKVIGTVDDDGFEVNCGAETILRDRHGWYGLIQSVDHVSKYHIAIVYTNEGGETWRYMDTGLFRSFEVDGDPYVSLSGRSTNVGPDGTGWVGRWVFNDAPDGGLVSLTGNAQGDIDLVACEALTG
jgi:hypothetical protein